MNIEKRFCDLAITQKDLRKNTFFCNQSRKVIRKCLNWLLEIITLYPKDNTYDKLMEWVEKYVEQLVNEHEART